MFLCTLVFHNGAQAMGRRRQTKEIALGYVGGVKGNILSTVGQSSDNGCARTCMLIRPRKCKQMDICVLSSDVNIHVQTAQTSANRA